MNFVYILAAILIFGVLIAIHEFGHFITAKASGVLVHEYSIGMGPLIWSRQGKETKYSLRLLPIGGYCAMEGEEEDSENPRALNNQGFFKKLIIYASGAGMNFLLGFLIVLMIYADASAFLTPEIVQLNDDFPTQGESGVMVGDRFYSINGERIYNFNDVQLVMSYGTFDEEGTLHAVLIRDGEKIERTMHLSEYTDEDGKPYTAYGFSYGGQEAATPGTILKYSWYNTIDFVRMVRLSLQMLVTGQAGVGDLTGPVGIVSTITQVGEESNSVGEAIENIAYFAALITVNLAVMNLLPIPALDGGKILFLILNVIAVALFRKKIPAKFENYLSVAFFALLMALMLFVTYSDISKLIS